MAQPSSNADLFQNPQSSSTVGPEISDLFQNPVGTEVTAADQRGAVGAGAATGAVTGATIAASTVGGMQAAAAVSKNPYVIGAGGAIGFGTGMVGSTFIDELLKKRFVPEQYYKDPELLPYYEGGFTFGSTIASAPIIFGVPTLVGGRVANHINNMSTTARQQPRGTLFREYTAGTSAGLAGGTAVAYNPDSFVLRLGAETAAGIINPTQLLVSGVQSVGSLIPLFKSRTNATARENDAVRYLESILLETGEDPSKLIERVRVPLPEGVPAPTAGQKTGSMALLALENTLTRTNRSYGTQRAAQAQDAFAAFETLIYKLRETNHPRALELAALKEKQFFSILLDNRFSHAEQEAAEAISKIRVDSPLTRQRVGEIIKDRSEKALIDSREYERALYNRAEANAVVITDGVITPRTLLPTNTNRGLLAATTSVSPEYLKNMQGYSTAEAILERFGIQKANIDTYNVGKNTESFLNRQTVPDEFVTGSETATVREMIQARSDLLALSRNAAPHDIQAARIYGEMAESILEDLNTLDLPDFKTARIYSEQLNDFFTRTYVADINASSRSGAEKFTPEVLIARAFGSNNDVTAARMESVIEATGFLNTEYQRLLTELGPDNPRVIELAPYAQAARDGLVSVGDAQRQWLLLGANRSFITDVDAPNGIRLDRNKLTNFITENESVLKDVGLLDDLTNANTADTTLRMVLDQNSAFNKGIKKQAAFALLLGKESPTAVIADALGSKNPTRSMRRLITLATNAKDGGAAVEGFKAALYDYAYAAAGGLSGNFSPTAYYNALHKPISYGRPSIISLMRSSKIMGAAEANRVKRLLMPMRKIEDGLANGLELEQIVGNKPSVFKNFAARVFGARAGALVATGGSTLVAAGAGSRVSQNFFENSPNLLIEQLLKDATLKDPELLVTLLSKTDLSNPSNSGILQRFLTQFSISGYAPLPTAINNYLQNFLSQEEQAPAPVIPPQARVQPTTSPTRGLPGMNMPAAGQADEQVAPPPQLAAADMYNQLFPFG